tara:strand:- start:2389 stop:4005 length:1617 start_codon:yes stop_codon:yes gene_type:complete
MAKGEYVLNIGDDNAVLSRIEDGKVVNAWMASSDPAMAQEELGEALAEDSKGRISILVDTLDQSFKVEEVPKVNILDRRKVLARHINMAFPGASLRGARLVDQVGKKTLLYEFASVPLDGRIPGWLDFIESLPNEKGGIHSIAAENVDLLQALAPKDAPAAEEGQNHWRHFIGVNVAGGLRQIIEKNGRLSLTRLTQAPPDDTAPEDFADMIIRDFKATITYIRRLGYQVGEPLDLIVLSSPEAKSVLHDLEWEGARSVSVYTPYEAGFLLGLGSIGREDQVYTDVLHAAWFASKRKSIMPMTRAAFLGDTSDDIKELAFAAAPYAAGLIAAAVIGWSGWTAYELIDYSGRNETLQAQLSQALGELSKEQAAVAALPSGVAQVRNVIDVAEILDRGKVNFMPYLNYISTALDGDAVVLSIELFNGTANAATQGSGRTNQPTANTLTINIETRLAEVISNADEAVQTARKIERDLKETFGNNFEVTMTKSPVAAQAADQLQGGFSGAQEGVGQGQSMLASGVTTRESFFAAYTIGRNGP